MSDYEQTYATTCAASVDDCFAVLTDFADYPRWASPITECRVLEHYPDGLPKRVAFALNAQIKTLRYVLEYSWDPPHGATWKLVEGDLAGVTGSYRFAPATAGTEATCSQSIDIGFWVPSFLRSTFERKALQDSVEEFRTAAEGRAARA